MLFLRESLLDFALTTPYRPGCVFFGLIPCIHTRASLAPGARVVVLGYDEELVSWTTWAPVVKRGLARESSNNG